MKKISLYTLLFAITMVAFQACGPSEEERRAAEQARLDSLRQVEEQRIAVMMQAREDSLAKVQAQEEMEQQKEQEQRPSFAEDGSYIVQLGAYRSESEANKYKNKLAQREYPQVYTIKVGDEETGDIWFRVRVGFFGSKEDAEEFGAQLGQELNTGYWVSKVSRTGN